MHKEFAAFAATKYNHATIKAYETDIRQFCDHCAAKGLKIVETTSADAESYRLRLTTQNIQTSTASRKLSALLAMFDWLVEVGKVKTNPFTGVQIKRNKAQIKKRRSTVGPDLDRLLAVITVTEPADVRDRCVLRVMHDTKLRLRDVLRFNVGNLDRGSITHPSLKNPLPLTKTTMDELRAYCATRLAGRPADSPLFLNKVNRRISDRSIRRRLAEHCAAAGINGLTPYAFSGTQRSSIK